MASLLILVFAGPTSQNGAGSEASSEGRFRVGVSYFVKGETPADAYGMFANHVKRGVIGVCVTKLPPEVVRKRHGLLHTPLVWITFGKAENALTPHDLEGVKHTMSEVFKEVGGGLLFMDCFDVLKTANGFERAMGFLREMKKLVAGSGWSALLWVNPQAFTAEQLEALGQELEEMK